MPSDYGADGIRANAVNADLPFRSADRRLHQRSAPMARGLSEKDYMSGNLLGREAPPTTSPRPSCTRPAGAENHRRRHHGGWRQPSPRRCADRAHPAFIPADPAD